MASIMIWFVIPFRLEIVKFNRRDLIAVVKQDSPLSTGSSLSTKVVGLKPERGRCDVTKIRARTPSPMR